jgi:hypothetical protein
MPDALPLILRCDNSDFVYSDASGFEYTQRLVVFVPDLPFYLSYLP